MRMKKVVFRFALVVVLLLSLMMSSCNGTKPPEPDISIIPIESGEITELSGESYEWVYYPSPFSIEPIQYQNGSYYFEGAPYSIFEYSIEDETVYHPCLDPQCTHRSNTSSCRFGRHLRDGYYRVLGEYIYYNTVFPMRLYRYNTETGENKPITEELNGFNSNVFTGNNYLYCNVYGGYIRTRYSDLKTEKVLESTDGKTNYTIYAEIEGTLYIGETSSGCVYTCPESDTSKLSLFWNGLWSNVWIGENTLSFQTKNNDGEYFHYVIGFDGTVSSETKLAGCAGWSSFCNGEDFYYMLRTDNGLDYSDGTPSKSPGMTVNSREVYKTNVETGETSVVFTFDGDYSSLYTSIGSSFYVVGDTLILSSLDGNILKENADGEKEPQRLNLGISNGIIMIDMTNGDITCVGDSGASAHGVDAIIAKREMRIGKETE